MVPSFGGAGISAPPPPLARCEMAKNRQAVTKTGFVNRIAKSTPFKTHSISKQVT